VKISLLAPVALRKSFLTCFALRLFTNFMNFLTHSFDAFLFSCYYHPHMLSIRLQRIGRKNAAAFRVLLTDSKNSSKSGKFKEILGHYTIKGDEVELKSDRIKHWMSFGAQPSDSVYNMLIKAGIIEGRKRNVLSKKSPTVARKELKKK